MKKLMIVAMMAFSATCAFAGDSPALKSILKAKTFQEADNLLKSTLAQLANDEEKAKAYNKLVDLAMDKFNKESATKTENEVMKQNKEVDVDGMNEAAYNALLAAIECDKYDQLPNAKGKVAPKFAEKNAQRVWGVRGQLVNAGQDAQNADKTDLCKRYWGAFVDSDEAALFKNSNRDFQKPFFGQVARIMGIYAYQDKNMEKCLHYCDIAMKDEGERANALNLKLEALSSDLKSKADSVKYLANVKELYAQNPDNDALLERIYNLHNAFGEQAEGKKVLEEALAKNPNNFVALADLGIGQLNDNPAQAEKYLRKAFEVKPDNALIVTYLATCLSIQAQDKQPGDPARKALYEEAVKLFDKAKELDPNKDTSNWGYNRYNAYYNLYGENDARTKQAEAEK